MTTGDCETATLVNHLSLPEIGMKQELIEMRVKSLSKQCQGSTWQRAHSGAEAIPLSPLPNSKLSCFIPQAFFLKRANMQKTWETTGVHQILKSVLRLSSRTKPYPCPCSQSSWEKDLNREFFFFLKPHYPSQKRKPTTNTKPSTCTWIF